MVETRRVVSEVVLRLLEKKPYDDGLANGLVAEGLVEVAVLAGVHAGLVDVADLTGVREDALVALGLVLAVVAAVHELVVAVLVVELVFAVNVQEVAALVLAPVEVFAHVGHDFVPLVREIEAPTTRSL